MLRRIFRNPDGGVGSSLSGAILPACASLVVPLLAVTALELPAAAIDRIASPVLGHSVDAASLFRPPASSSASGSVSAAGAYGAVLASEYNSRLLVPEVLVAGNRYSVTRPRPSYDDMLAKERLPNWS